MKSLRTVIVRLKDEDGLEKEHELCLPEGRGGREWVDGKFVAFGGIEVEQRFADGIYEAEKAVESMNRNAQAIKDAAAALAQPNDKAKVALKAAGVDAVEGQPRLQEQSELYKRLDAAEKSLASYSLKLDYLLYRGRTLLHTLLRDDF